MQQVQQCLGIGFSHKTAESSVWPPFPLFPHAQALGCMPQLEVFDIQCNKFNDASAAALATSISLLKRLRDINASGNAWTAKGIAKCVGNWQEF